MKIDIWSDVRCPFCYIGKRKFEAALERFAHKDKVEVVWHSFQLDPTLETRSDLNVSDYLAERKGLTREQVEQMHQHVQDAAGEIGLHFNFDRAVLANSFNAHRLIQFAKTQGLGNDMEERLFKAHFIDGENIDDGETLVQIGVSIGLSPVETKEVIASNAYHGEVSQDELTAQRIGIRGVPFFVFNEKYAVSGAQSPEIFLETLQQSWSEFEKDNGPVVLEGETCSRDGDCD
jgi:predicted DsbA family dithiol-disulfide isomerase